MSGYHVPIMANEVIEGLNVREGVYLDCTLGGGGHSELILRAHPESRLIAIDKDLDAIAYNKRLELEYPGRVTLVHGDYSDAAAIVASLGIDSLDGVLMDLGISSHQIDTAERGFSYCADARLDMRMDQTQTLAAYDVVNGYKREELEHILYAYGEEPFAKKIVGNILAARAVKPIETTLELSRLVEAAVPARLRAKQGHPAKRTFQAIRIAVNGELTTLDRTVTQLAGLLSSGGRMAVLTFHSLEDRIVKQAFKLMETDCICDKSSPICVCHHRATLTQYGQRFFTSTEEELRNNPRAASAKLRIVAKL